MTLADALAEMVRGLISDRGWSQREFAKRFGVTQGAVSFLLSGQRRQETLVYCERLAAIFGLPFSELCRQLKEHVAEQ